MLRCAAFAVLILLGAALVPDDGFARGEHRFTGRPHPSHPIAGRPGGRPIAGRSGRLAHPIAGRPGYPIAGYPGGGRYPYYSRRGAAYGAAVGAAAAGAYCGSGYNGCLQDTYGNWGVPTGRPAFSLLTEATASDDPSIAHWHRGRVVIAVAA